MKGSSDGQAKPFLSVAVIALNEADRIGTLLESCSLADEVIVVDSGSTDGTVQICVQLGATVSHRPWSGYAEQKQYALDQASGQWILNLDADEVLSPESAREILHALHEADPSVDAFSIPRLSRYLERWIKHGGWYPDRKVRLVRRGCGRWVGDGLHEALTVEGRVQSLRYPILHFVYRDVSDQVTTINQFSSISANSRHYQTSAAYVILGLFHAVGKFLECAVWKLGILDGIPGLIIATNSAFYVFLKHAKAWEKGLENE